uniref:Uncharacterized protein n=1 Tax=Anguilla anguilla TaxID=7936 RepID=A0A0E9TSI1_ANGAN
MLMSQSLLLEGRFRSTIRNETKRFQNVAEKTAAV